MTDIKKILVARLQDFDPTLDVSEGSPADSIIVSPVAEILSNNAIATDSNEFIRAKLVEAFPDITFGAGDALTDILVNAPSVLLEPYRAEIQRIASAQSLSNVANMADDDVDALASNWLVNRITGSRARSTVTIKLSVPRPLSINLNVKFVTRGGLIFNPASQYTITENQVVTFQAADGSYEIPVQCVAELPGSQYNVGVGDIVAVTNMDGVVSVTNTSQAFGGIDREDNTALVNRIPQVVSERSLVTDRGIRAKILSEEATVKGVAVVGHGDPEMKRDSISVNSYGKVKGSGFFYSYGPFGILTMYNGVPVKGDELHCKLINGEETYNFEIEDVAEIGEVGDLLVGAQTYYLKGSFFGTLGLVSVVLSEKASLVTDTLPPTTRIGGKVDVYITPNNDVESSFDVSDRYQGGLEGIGVQVQSAAAGHKSVIRLFINGTTVSSNEPFIGDGYKYVVVHSGTYRGAYKVLGTALDIAASKVGVIVDADLSALGVGIDLSARWRGCNELNISLNEPDYLIEPYGPNELSVTVGSDLKTFNTRTNVLRYVLPGDILNIPELNSSLAIAEIRNGQLITERAISSIGTYESTVTRSSSSIPDVITHINSLLMDSGGLNYSKCLGAEVISASEPKLLSEGGLGVSLPSYYDLFKQDDRRLSVGADDSSYSIRIANNFDNTYLNWTNPSSDMRPDAFIVRVVFNLATNTGDDADAFEIMLPNDMLVKGQYCVISCYGDLDIDSLISATELVYAQGGAMQDLSSLVDISSKQPILASKGDIITYNSNTHLIDDVFKVRFNINTPVDDSGIRTVDAKTVKIDLIRTSSSIEPPTSAGAQRSFRFSTNSLGTLPAIDFLDLIKMLCRPAKLRYDNLLWQNATGQYSLQGLPTNNTNYSIDSIIDEEYVVATHEPSRSAVNIYYSSEEAVSLTLPYKRKISHIAINSMFSDPAENYVSPALFKAGDAVLDMGYVGYVKREHNWQRDGVFSNQVESFSEIECANSFIEDAENYQGDYLIISGVPASQLVNTKEINNVDMLKESFKVRGSVPNTLMYRLYLREDSANGVTISSLLENNTYEAWIAHYYDASDVLDNGFDDLRNPYGFSVREVLNSLDPTLRVVNDFSSPEESSSYTFYLLDEYSESSQGLPTFSTTAGSNELTLNSLYVNHEVDIPINIKGDFIWVDNLDGTVSQQTVVSTHSESIVIDKTMPSSTGSVDAYGWCYIDSDNPNKLIIEGPSVMYADPSGNIVRSTLLISDNACGINCGGTSRFLSNLDVGKTLTLINTVFDPVSYLTDVDESGQALEDTYPTIANDLESLRVFSAHLGSFEVAQVETLSEYDVYLDAEAVYRQVITLNDIPDLTLLGKASDVSAYVPSFFRLSSDRISVESDVLKTCVAAQIYHREPYTYKVSKIPMDYSILNQRIRLSTLSDTDPGESNDDIFETRNLGGIVYYVNDLSRMPYVIYQPNKLNFYTEPYYGNIYKASLDCVFLNTIKPEEGTVLPVNNADIDGYYTHSDGLAFSTEESVMLSMPPVIIRDGERIDMTKQSLSLTYESSPTVATLEDKYNSPRHRSVCSDILVRRASPCYLGVYLRYTGGSSSDVVRSDIKNLVTNSLVSSFDISASDIISLAHKRGAKFITESAIYMVILDQSRVRRIFIARGTLNQAIRGTYDGTIRTTGIEIPTAAKLGVVIDVEKN